jgi:chromosome segregation ATPase
MFSRLFRPSLSQEDNTSAAAESTAELDDAMMVFLEEHNKSLGEAGNDVAESKEKNRMKESCIRALTDLNKEMKSVVDAQQKEIEMALTTSQQHYIGEKESIREILMKVETWCELIKDLKAEADALRQEMDIIVKEVAKDNECLTKERDASCYAAKQASAELVKQLIWTEQLETANKLLAAKAAQDKEAAERERQLNCCKEEMTRCQNDLVQDPSEKHTAEDSKTAQQKEKKMSMKNDTNEAWTLHEKAQLIKELCVLRAEADTLRQEMDTMVKAMQSLTKERDVAKKAQAELVNQLQTWTEDLESLCKLQVKKDKEAAEYCRQLRCRQEELTKCQSDLAQATSENCCLVKSLEDTETNLAELQQINLMKESCIKALTDDMNKEMKSVVDVQQKEIEMVLATSHQVKMENEKRIKELTTELDDLRQRMFFLRESNTALIKSLGEAGTNLEESKQTSSRTM